MRYFYAHYMLHRYMHARTGMYRYICLDYGLINNRSGDFQIGIMKINQCIFGSVLVPVQVVFSCILIYQNS